MCRLASSAVVAAIVFNVARAHEVTPLERVASLLSGLQKRVNEEGRAEAKTYNNFACFCKSTIAKKSKAIAEGRSDRDSLQTRINSDEDLREKLDVKIAAKLKEASESEKAIKVSAADRQIEYLKYSKGELELSSGIQALERAIVKLKNAKGRISFAQLTPNERRAVFMSQTMLPNARSSEMLALLADGAPEDSYGFHADDLVDTLEGLATQFRKKKVELDKVEVDARHTHTSLLQNQETDMKNAQEALESAKKDKAQASSRIATTSQDLTAAAADLLDNQRYLAELSAKCQEKAVLWDQRSNARAAELQALTAAIDMVKSLPPPTNAVPASPAPAPAALNFLQHNSRSGAAPVSTVVQVPSTRTGIRRHTDDAPLIPTNTSSAKHENATSPEVQHVKSLLRVRESGATANVITSRQLRGTRAHAVSLLRHQADLLKSSVLAGLVVHAMADPLGKVKMMVQQLVDRLQKQVAAEASHKGWCDKQYAVAYQKRDTAGTNVKDINSLLEQDEARIEKLEEQIPELQRNVDELRVSLQESQTLREQEKAENARTVKDAKLGKDIVQKTITALTLFYKSVVKQAAAAPASALLQEVADAPASAFFDVGDNPGSALLQEIAGAPAAAFLDMRTTATADPDKSAPPDAGFDEPYAGSQDASMGVLSMLDVVQSDFEQRRKKSIEAEEKAVVNFKQFELSTSTSLASKSQVLKSKHTAKVDAQGEITENMSKLRQSSDTVSKALREIEALDKACQDKGMTPAERQIKREDEMDALKKALCILSSDEAEQMSC